MNILRPMVLALVAALGCVDAFVALPIGPINATVTLPVQAVPQVLLGSDGALQRIACGAASPCPQPATAEVVVSCVDAACALAPFALRAVTPDIDLTSYEVYRDYANSLQEITVQAVSVRLTGANVGNSVGPLDVWWTPASTGADVPEHHLGAAPRTPLSRSPMDVSVAVDAAGVSDLVTHLLAGNTRLRLRLEGPLDLGSGALPAAQVHLAVTLLLHVHGSL